MELGLPVVSGELTLAILVTVFSLLAVCVPLWRGLAIARHARRTTRRVGPEEIRRQLAGRTPDAHELICIAAARVLEESLRENEAAGHPEGFVRDAARQYMMNEYEVNYSRPISMYSNILPPLGFIGTTLGLLVLFVSMHLSSASLELGALAFALTSSIFALMGFAVLEGLRIRLYRRLLVCLDEAFARPPVAAEAA